MRANSREHLLGKGQAGAAGRSPSIASLPEQEKGGSLGKHKGVEPPRRILGEGRGGKSSPRSLCFFRNYHMPGTVSRTFHAFSHLDLTNVSKNSYNFYYVYFLDQ